MSEPQDSNPFHNRQFYELLLAYADSELASWGDQLPSMVAFLMKDGTFRFSVGSPIGVLTDVLRESKLSDRLLVIVSVAYLEDQIRLLLAKFLTKDDETGKLLDPASGPLLLLDVARLAVSLGLIAKEWFEILKQMAKLRNKFAHDPLAQSFEDLIKKDSKQTWKSLDQLSRLYEQLAQKELSGTIHENFSWVFMFVYTLIQFSIDHLATVQALGKLDSGEIIGTNYMEGLTREVIQNMLDNNFGTD